MNPLSRLSGLLLVICALASGIAEARDIYVDKNAANAADSNAGSSSAPLKTIQAAANLTNPGDVVIVRAGTYTETALKPNENYAGIHITRSGTEGTPITFKSEVEGGAIIDQGFKSTGFALWDVHDVTISGFKITRCDGGGVYMVNGEQHTRIIVDHNTISNCDGAAGGNIAGIYMSQCTSCTISHNRISTIRVGGVNYQNAAGIHGYSQEMSVIEYNDISDAYNGVFHKRSSGNKGLTIRYNYIHDVTQGVWYSVSAAGDPPHIGQEVLNNVFSNVDECIRAIVFETKTQSTGLTIKNNVFDRCGTAVGTHGMYGITIQNNIFYNTPMAFTTEDPWRNVLTLDSNNLYYPSTKFTLGLYTSSQQNLASLDLWKSTTGFGKGSLIGDPRFVSATDYHLQSNSPAKNAGADGLDMGPYPNGTGQVGVGGVSAPKPMPPSAVTVK